MLVTLRSQSVRVMSHYLLFSIHGIHWNNCLRSFRLLKASSCSSCSLAIFSSYSSCILANSSGRSSRWRGEAALPSSAYFSDLIAWITVIMSLRVCSISRCCFSCKRRDEEGKVKWAGKLKEATANFTPKDIDKIIYLSALSSSLYFRWVLLFVAPVH